MTAIASQRAVQLSTVQSYIAEAMAAGYSYAWHRMDIPFSILACLCGHVRAYHKQQLLSLEQQQQSVAADIHQGQIQDCQQHQAGPQNRPCGTDDSPQPALIKISLDPAASQAQQLEQKPLQHSQLPALRVHPLPGEQQHQEGHFPLHGAAAGACDRPLGGGGQRSMQGHGVCSQCGLLQEDPTLRLQPSGLYHLDNENSTGAAEPLQPSVQLPDMQVIRQLVLTSKEAKALRDSMESCLLTYGHMRLGLAHMFCLLRHQTCSCCHLCLTA